MVMPHTMHTATSAAGLPPNRKPMVAAHVPEMAMAAIVMVVRPRRSASRPAAIDPMPPAAIVANAVSLAANDAASGDMVGREARREEHADPRPHGIELPHVAEIAHVGEAQRHVAPRVQHGARLERRRRGSIRAEPCAPDQPGRAKRGEGRHDHRHVPIDAAQRVEQMRQRGPEGERTDENADHEAHVALGPRGCELHADGIHAGERHAGREAKQRRDGRGRIHDEQEPVRDGAAERAQREKTPRVDAVGQARGSR